MATKYFALLTNVGAAKLAKATALGTEVEITQMAVGDGNGALPTPNPAQTALTHEQRRAQLNMLTIDPVNTNQIIAEQVIPEEVGGWWIREIGLFDKDGDMIAVANCAETYKPQLQEGSGRVQVIRVILIVSSTEAVTLKIDPSVVLATRKYVDDAVIEVKAYADDVMKKHVDAANPHKQYPLIVNALKEMVDAGLVDEILKNLSLEETVNLAKNALQVSPKPLAVDLNTLGAIDSAGVYAQTLDANATTANHYPINQAGTLVVTPSAYGCQQEYTSFSSGRKFTRGLAQVWNGIDGPWKNWVEFYGTTNKPTASDVGALAVGGVAESAKKLSVARLINGVSFDGTNNIDLGLGEASKLNVASNGDMQASPGSAELLTTVAAVMSVLPTRAMSSTDYIRIPDKPGGLIIQWGTTPIIPKASWVDVTFPIPFPSSFLSLMAIFKEANSGCIEYRPYSGASMLTGCQIGEGGAAHYSGLNRAIYIAIGQ